MALVNQWVATCDHCDVTAVASADDMYSRADAVSALRQGSWVVGEGYLFCDSVCEEQYNDLQTMED